MTESKDHPRDADSPDRLIALSPECHWGFARSIEPRFGLDWAGLGRAELGRLDDYSDLDFFVVVEPGHKLNFIQQLDWLTVPALIAYAFRNTTDGYKVLYEDGVFCEFAAGRIVWKRLVCRTPGDRPRRIGPALISHQRIGRSANC